MNIPDFFGGERPLRLALTLAHFLWQATAVGVLAGLAGAVLRKSSAPLRYGVFLAALALLALCPIVTYPLTHVAPPGTLTTAAASSGDGVAPLPQEAPPAAPIRPAEPLAEGPSVSGPAGGLAASDVRSPPPPSRSVGMVAPEKPPEDRWQAWRRGAPIVMAVYLAGVALMLARLLAGLHGGRRLRRGSLPADDPLLPEAVARCARAVGLRFTPAAAYCRRVAVPTVVGILRPMILLPLCLSSGLAPSQVEAVLSHELAHIRRYDQLVNILQRVIESFLFFHPAVWYVSRKIRREREHCCDDLAVAAGGQRYAYAESLVRLAEASREWRRGWPRRGESISQLASSSAGERPSALYLRVARLLGAGSHERVRLSRTWPLAAVLLAAGLLAAAAMKPTSAPPVPPAEPNTPTTTKPARTRPASGPSTGPASQAVDPSALWRAKREMNRWTASLDRDTRALLEGVLGPDVQVIRPVKIDGEALTVDRFGFDFRVPKSEFVMGTLKRTTFSVEGNRVKMVFNGTHDLAEFRVLLRPGEDQYQVLVAAYNATPGGVDKQGTLEDLTRYRALLELKAVMLPVGSENLFLRFECGGRKGILAGNTNNRAIVVQMYLAESKEFLSMVVVPKPGATMDDIYRALSVLEIRKVRGTESRPATQPAGASAARIAELIAQLGSEKVQDREVAHSVLVAIGKPAVEALQAATRDKDVERSQRARAVLAEIRRQTADPAKVLKGSGWKLCVRLTYAGPREGAGKTPLSLDMFASAVLALAPGEDELLAYNLKAGPVIDFLAEKGFFESAARGAPKPPPNDKPLYRLTIGARNWDGPMEGQGDWRTESTFTGDLGWGPDTLAYLEALRKVLKGEPASEMDRLLTRARPALKAPATQPAGAPASRAAPGTATAPAAKRCTDDNDGEWAQESVPGGMLKVTRLRDSNYIGWRWTFVPKGSDKEEALPDLDAASSMVELLASPDGNCLAVLSECEACWYLSVVDLAALLKDRKVKELAGAGTWPGSMSLVKWAGGKLIVESDELLTHPRGEGEDTTPMFGEPQRFALDPATGKFTALSEAAKDPVRFFAAKLPAGSHDDLYRWTLAVVRAKGEAALPALRQELAARRDKDDREVVQMAIDRLAAADARKAATRPAAGPATAPATPSAVSGPARPAGGPADTRRPASAALRR